MSVNFKTDGQTKQSFTDHPTFNLQMSNVSAPIIWHLEIKVWWSEKLWFVFHVIAMHSAPTFTMLVHYILSKNLWIIATQFIATILGSWDGLCILSRNRFHCFYVFFCKFFAHYFHPRKINGLWKSDTKICSVDDLYFVLDNNFRTWQICSSDDSNFVFDN